MTGILEILNVGEGDTKLTFDSDKPEDVKRAKAVVADMLKRGFAIFVEVGEKDGEPLYRRATAFDEKTCEYLIVGLPESELEDEAKSAPKPRKRRARKAAPRRVSARSANAVAVSRSAGG